MKLILVRHAEAVAKGDNGVASDFDRPLTENGREQARKLATALLAHGVAPSAVLTSPLVRARETAEPLLPLLPGPEREPVVTDYLAVGELRPKKLAKLIADVGSETVILVGHNPDLSAYAGWLLGTDETAIELEKGAAAFIEFDGEVEKGAGRLGWLVTPGWYMGAVAPVGG
jgi:phosphohistidine phosphatase